MIVIAPRIENVLAVAVERQICLEGLAGEAADELGNVEGLGLGEGLAAAVGLRAGTGRGALAAPFVAKVAIEINTRTLTSMGAHVLAPQTIGGVRVLVAIGIGHRMNVPVDVPHVLGQIVPTLGQLIGNKGNRCGTDPFACVHATIDPDARIACVAIGDSARIRKIYDTSV